MVSIVGSSIACESVHLIHEHKSLDLNDACSSSSSSSSSGRLDWAGIPVFANKTPGPSLIATPTAKTMARERWIQRRKVRREDGSSQSSQGNTWGGSLLPATAFSCGSPHSGRGICHSWPRVNSCGASAYWTLSI